MPLIIQRHSDYEGSDIGDPLPISHDDLKQRLLMLIRQRYKLKEQQALFGPHTPAHILIQIEDLEAEIERLQQILDESQDPLNSTRWLPPPDTLPEPVIPQQFAADLVALYQRAAAEKKGRLAFLTGPQYSGRQALAKQVMNRAVELGAATVDLTFLKSPDGRELRLHQTGRPAHLKLATGYEEFGQSLGALARQQPLILNVRNIEVAHRLWWPALEKEVLPELYQDWPALLLVHLTTFEPLEEIQAALDREDTSLLAQATRLWADQANEWVEDFFLGDPLAAADIAAYVGPARPEIPELLRAETGGEPRFVLTLWEDWRGQGLVEPDAGEQWHFSEEVEHPVFGDTRRFVESLLAGLVTPETEFDEEEARAILQIAALEGETFTAEAVAGVLALDHDELIDFLDRTLCCLADEEAEPPPGQTPLLAEADWAVLQPDADEPVYLARYRFARPVFYHVWAKYGSLADGRRWSGQLAQQLARLYAPDPAQVEETLIRLFERAGQSEQAALYRQRQAVPPNVAALRWLVGLYQREWEEYRQRHGQLDPDEELDRFLKLKQLYDVAMELAGQLVDMPRYWQEGSQVAELAQEVAHQMPSLDREARGLFFVGRHQRNARHYDTALNKFQEALILFERAGDLLNLGTTYHNIGRVYFDQAQYDQALEWYDQARMLEEQTGDIRELGSTCHEIGRIYHHQGWHKEAVKWYDQARALFEQTGDVFDLGVACHTIGQVYHAQSEYDEALKWYEQARIFEKQTGNDKDLGIIYHRVGRVYLAQENWPLAQANVERALALMRQSGAKPEMIEEVEQDLARVRQQGGPVEEGG